MQRDEHFLRAIDLEGVSDAAKRMGVSRQRIYQLIDSGELDFYRFGKRVMVHRADVSRLIEKRLRANG
jgi:excisionase family DNA binding protein